MNLRRPLLPLLFLVPLAHAEVVDHIVAVINEEIVTASDITKFTRKLESGGLVDDALLRLTDQATLLKDKKALVEYMINERLLDSEVKKRGLAVTFEQVEQEIRNITQQKNITRAQLKEALRENHVDFSEYQDFIKTSLERHSLIEKEVRSKIKVSDEDIAAAYVAKKGSGSDKVYEFTLAQILFRPQRGGEAAARTRAERVLKKIQSHEMPFDKMVQHYTEDPHTTDDGVLGTFRVGEMPPDMVKAVINLNVGETSPIVHTKAGYHIFKVTDKKMVEDQNFEKQKEQIFAGLMNDAFKRQFKIWLDQRRRDAFVKVNPS